MPLPFSPRLFQGMDSGFAGGEDETYNVYDQPFRGGRDMASNIYRPSKNIDKDAYTDDFDTLMHNNRYYRLLCFYFIRINSVVVFQRAMKKKFLHDQH